MNKFAKTLTRMPVCYDCLLPYGSSSWADVLVPDEIWKQITPATGSGGLLCFNCMVRRLTALGLRNVPYSIVSGPFALHIRDTVED